MKIVEKFKFSESVFGLMIRPYRFDLWNDKIWLKNLISTIFLKNEIIIFKFVRENSFYLEENLLLRLRKEIPDYFTRNGEYWIFKQLDIKRFGAFGILKYDDMHLDFILDAWNYCESFGFFSIKENKLKSFFNDHSFETIHTDFNMLIPSYTNFDIGKGLDPLNIQIYYSSNIKTTSIENAINYVPHL